MTLRVDAFLLLGCDSASLNDWYTTFGGILVGQFAKAEMYRNEYDFSLDLGTLENGTHRFSYYLQWRVRSLFGSNWTELEV
jgi:hypothetical protein